MGHDLPGGNWECARRVLPKAEVLEKGTNTRFVLTRRSDELRSSTTGASDAERPKGWIEDFKRALKADRLSYYRFWGN